MPENTPEDDEIYPTYPILEPLPYATTGYNLSEIKSEVPNPQAQDPSPASSSLIITPHEGVGDDNDATDEDNTGAGSVTPENTAILTPHAPELGAVSTRAAVDMSPIENTNPVEVEDIGVAPETPPTTAEITPKVPPETPTVAETTEVTTAAEVAEVLIAPEPLPKSPMSTPEMPLPTEHSTEPDTEQPETKAITTPEPQTRLTEQITERQKPSVKWGETIPRRYEYVEPEETYGLTPAEVDVKYREALQAARDSREFEGTRDLTQQEVDQHGRFSEEIVKIGRERLDVDLSDRVTDTKHIHIFPRAADFDTALWEYMGDDDIKNTRGARIPSIGIMATEDRSSKLRPTMTTILHETVHDMSSSLVVPRLKQDEEGNIVVDLAQSSSISNYAAQVGQGFDEAVTDMVTHRAMLSSGMGRIIPNYRMGTLILSGVISDVGLSSLRHRGYNPQVVEDYITVGMLTQSISGLRMIRHVLGDNAIDALKAMPRRMSASEAYKIAKDTGSHYAMQNIEFGGTNADPWFRWRR